MSIRAAVIGCGKRGQLHARGLATVDDVEVVACVDPAQKLAEGLASTHHGRAFAETGTMLAAIEPDEQARAKLEMQLAPVEEVAAAKVAAFLQAGGRDVYFVFSVADLPRDTGFVIVPLRGKADADAIINWALGKAPAVEGAPPPVPEDGLARRDAVKRVGIGAAILLPLVTSILAPSPAEAAATCLVGAGACAGANNGTPCTCTVPPCVLGSCQSGVCNDPPGC